MTQSMTVQRGSALREPAREYVAFPGVPRRDAWQAAIEIPLIVRAFGIARGLRVLEIGCGRANAFAPFVARCAPRRLVGLDIDASLVSEARRNVKAAGIAAELFLGDARRLPFGNAEFDLVFDFGTCYHITFPDRALAEIARVLVPGGRLIHETPFGQLLAHPIRTSGRRLPWSVVPELEPERDALLFASRVRRTA